MRLGIVRINDYAGWPGIVRDSGWLQPFDDVTGFAGLVNQSTGLRQIRSSLAGYNRVILAILISDVN